MAFQRFINRRGVSATLTSDNAKTFKVSSKENTKIAWSAEVQHYTILQGTLWKDHLGGEEERGRGKRILEKKLIQIVKKCLRKV